VTRANLISKRLELLHESRADTREKDNFEVSSISVIVHLLLDFIQQCLDAVAVAAKVLRCGK